MYTGPVQEHYVRWLPRYSAGDVGRYLAPPAAVWTEEWPQPAIPFPIDDLCKAARLTAVLREPLRVAIAARRYQQARTERTRPADKIVDYVVAIEAITQSSHGQIQGELLSEIIGGDDQDRERAKSDFELVKTTRNDILHYGKTPHRADGIASIARSLVDRGILGVVR
jgi:hypothetical protein